MSYCPQIGCSGHLGKFDSCRDEALFELSLDGTCDSTGDVEFDGHFCLIDLDKPTEVDVVGLKVTVPIGHYIVQTTNSGAVSVMEFKSAGDARQVFNRFDREFGKWLDS